MAAEAKSKATRKDLDRYRQSIVTEMKSETRVPADTDRFVFQSRSEKRLRGAPRKEAKAKAKLATFSLTSEDLGFIDKPTFQVIQALGTGVNKSQAVRLAMRAFAGLSVEEIRDILNRTPARELSRSIGRKE